MNRIILIGNGFDLAHDLKTGYKSFIDDLWKNKASLMSSKFKSYSIEDIDYDGDIDLEFYDHSIIIDFWNMPNFNECTDYTTFKDKLAGLGVRIKFKNTFLEAITIKNMESWVDIEKEYYISLKKCLKDCVDDHGDVINTDSIDKLNVEIEVIKNLLIKYLNDNQVDLKQYNPFIFDRMISEFKYKDFTQNYKRLFLSKMIDYVNSILNREISNIDDSVRDLESKFSSSDVNKTQVVESLLKSPNASYYFKELNVDNILFLNFNYTETHWIYRNDIKNVGRFGHEPRIELKTINIHGDLKDDENPAIFGFGDEIDKSFDEIEDLDNNKFLENIKSTGYHETSNYKQLLEYIDSDYFQIFIFGHSCGLSDRTMLSTLFNHENCVSIKPFYYKNKDGNDNYSDLVRNISRHFTDKASLRDKVVNKEYCEPLVGSK